MRYIIALLLISIATAACPVWAADDTRGYPTNNTLAINADKAGATINKNIYGHFAEHLGRCIYEGIWVGPESSIPNTRGIRNDIVAALRDIKVPVIRWPGGCFADTYHWKDGIGPQEKRKPILNDFWGDVYEDNSFGTHEFMDLCEQIGCEAYIAGNLGSGTVQEMRDWTEYITFEGKSPMADLRRAHGREKPWKLGYFGAGNESWSCGGTMTVEYYADMYRRYKTYLHNYSGGKLFVIACGPNEDDYHWTEVLMKKATETKGRGRDLRMGGLSMHYYCDSGRKRRHATKFNLEDWFYQFKKAVFMEDLLDNHIAIMDKYDPDNRIALIVDEWGCWHHPIGGTHPAFLCQQNTLHDALVAGVNLNMFNQHCRRVKMANIAQMVNVLQSVILTQAEKMILTPTYYTFKMCAVHQDATLLPTELSCDDYTYGDKKLPSVSVSASKDSSGKIHITLCNINPENPVTLNCRLEDAAAKKVTGQILTRDDINAHNTFNDPEAVKPTVFKGAKLKDNQLTAALPAKSLVVLEIK
jgi:alpha-N-arabinofuranosidase